jgi:hypothetical protein
MGVRETLLERLNAPHPHGFRQITNAAIAVILESMFC